MQAETATNGLKYSKLIVDQMHFKSHVKLKDSYLQHNSDSQWGNMRTPCNEIFWKMLVNKQARLF